MSTSSKPKTKAEIESENKELQKQLKDLKSEITKLSNSKPPAIDPMIEEQLKTLTKENEILSNQVKEKEDRNALVGVRSLIFGDTWLPDPISQSGDPKDVNKGKKLKGMQSTVIPSSWAVYYLTNNQKSFADGNVIFDNGAGSKVMPSGVFAEIEANPAWLDNMIDAAWVEKTIYNKPQDLSEFISHNSDNYLVMKKLLTVLEELSDSAPEDKHFAFESFFARVDKILTPDKKDEQN